MKNENNPLNGTSVQRGDPFAEKHARAKALVETVGHPLHTLTLENERITALLDEMTCKLEAQEDVTKQLCELRALAVHYAKKGDLLYPLLKVRYQVSGPSDMMWTTDDEIRDEITALCREHAPNDRIESLVKRVRQMVYLEANVLFPICALDFTQDEWMGIYEDAKDYAPCFDVRVKWDEAEQAAAKTRSEAWCEGEIVMPGGHMTVAQMTAMLNVLPMEITFVDANDINCYFNEGPKVFKRPQMAIGREVFSCHPPKIEKMVKAILSDFRSGKRDSVPVWMDKGGKPFLVTYYAVRSKDGAYLGTVEVVQDMTAAQEHFQKT